MKRGKRGACPIEILPPSGPPRQRQTATTATADSGGAATTATADNGGVTIGRRGESGGATMKRRDNHRERGGAAKVAERGEKIRLCRTSRRCANFPVCPPTSATGHPAAAHFRGRARELNPPAATIPFFKISLGGGTTHEAANRTPLPGCGHPFFKISLGGRGAFLGKKGPPHSHPPSRHPPALLRGNEKSGGRRSVRKRSANPQNPKRRNKPALSAPRRNPHSGKALPRAAAGNRRRRRRGPENFSRIAHFLLLFLKKILTSGIFCAILYKT